ncbi:MAG: hypothetical protein H7Z75_00470 [Ferruginibacter sp.]|nr:hypothetical protein [Cytophagales bacterium]
MSLVLVLLFLIFFWLHALGSHRDYNLEQQLKRQPTVSFPEHLGSSRLWFESFQNWQSEFLAIATTVVLSIFLRQKGPPVQASGRPRRADGRLNEGNYELRIGSPTRFVIRNSF